jgi:trk system potassium uptake protein TrkA
MPARPPWGADEGEYEAVHFVIMGCGRTGSTLAQMVEGRGHTAAVIDQNPDAFRRLGSTFEGQRVTGVGFDREILRQAGIDDAYAFAAVSSGDNSNILAARVAREVFGVSNVVARIYDPGRAEVYQRLGIPTVATVRWTADQIIRRLLPVGATSEFRDPSGLLVLAEIHVNPGWVGQRLAAIESVAAARVAYVTRLGEGMVPTAETVYQEGDLVHVMIREAQLPVAESVLAEPPARGGS